MVAKNQGLSRLSQAWMTCLFLFRKIKLSFVKMIIIVMPYSLEILNSYRSKLDIQLECFSGRESVKVSRDAQLHPWAAALFTDRNSLFAAPDVEQLRLPHQSSRTLMSRSEFVELKATFWLIARSLLFDVPSRNFSKK